MSRGNMGKRLRLETRIYSSASDIMDCYTRNLLSTDNLNIWYIGVINGVFFVRYIIDPSESFFNFQKIDLIIFEYYFIKFNLK